MPEIAHIIRPAIHCATTSAEKVDNVVSPPRKPVTISKRHSGGADWWMLKSATSTPTRWPPSRLAVNAPGGIDGQQWIELLAQTPAQQGTERGVDADNSDGEGQRSALSGGAWNRCQSDLGFHSAASKGSLIAGMWAAANR